MTRTRGFQRARAQTKGVLTLFGLYFVAKGLLLGQVPAFVTPTGEAMSRVGIYVWDGYPCSPTALIESVEAAMALGSRAVRIYAGPYWDYRCGSPDQSELRAKLQRGDYAWVLQSGMREIWITAYDVASAYTRYRTPDRPFSQLSAKQAHYWGFSSAMNLHHRLGRGVNADDWASTREEFRRAAYAIACAVPISTTVFLSNWEARHDTVDPQFWPLYMQYLQARIDGTNLGSHEARAHGCKGRVLAAVEFVDPPSFPSEGLAVTDFNGIVARLTGLNALAYSTWRTLDQQTATLRISLVTAIRDIGGRAREKKLPADIYLSEFGNPRTLHPDAAERMAIVITTASENHVRGLFYWNLVDQVAYDSHGRFAGDTGLYDRHLRLTPFGEAFAGWGRVVGTSPTPRPRPFR